jgi:hypothetical protein
MHTPTVALAKRGAATEERTKKQKTDFSPEKSPGIERSKR